MSRSGYSDGYGDDADYPNAMWLYRKAVDNAIDGKRGQALLRDLLAALDAMPRKSLERDALVTEDGNVCALGCLGVARGITFPAELHDCDGDNELYRRAQLAKLFNIAPCLAAEIMYFNDDAGSETEGPERRWTRMRAWVAKQVHPVAKDAAK